MEQAILDGLQNLQLTKEEEEGIQLSNPSREEWLEECHLSLFGKLLSDRKQNQRALKSILRSAWRMGSELRIVEVGNDIFQFKFNSKHQLEWVEKNGPWNFDNNLLLLSRWRKGLTATNICFSHSPFWVQIWGIPFELMREETGRDVGNKIGKCLEVDRRPWQSDQAKYMRVRVEMLLNKPLLRGGYLLNEEGERMWVSFKYERLPTVCYRCGVLGHDNRHCAVIGAEQGVESQYGDWIRANGSSRSGQERMNSRPEMNHSPNGLEQMAAQPSSEGTDVSSSGGRSAQRGNARVAKQQVGQSKAGGMGQSKSQEACHSGGWDNAKVRPQSVGLSETMCEVGEMLNIETNVNTGVEPVGDPAEVGSQQRPIIRDIKVSNQDKPSIDFNVFKEDGFLDLGCTRKNKEPKTIGSWKRLARKKGPCTGDMSLAQEFCSKIKRAGDLEKLETEENRKAKRKQKKNALGAAVTAEQHRREP